jgi:hypothetical protein
LRVLVVGVVVQALNSLGPSRLVRVV